MILYSWTRNVNKQMHMPRVTIPVAWKVLPASEIVEKISYLSKKRTKKKAIFIPGMCFVKMQLLFVFLNISSKLCNSCFLWETSFVARNQDLDFSKQSSNHWLHESKVPVWDHLGGSVIKNIDGSFKSWPRDLGPVREDRFNRWLVTSIWGDQKVALKKLVDLYIYIYIYIP